MGRAFVGGLRVSCPARLRLGVGSCCVVALALSVFERVVAFDYEG